MISCAILHLFVLWDSASGTIGEREPSVRVGVNNLLSESDLRRE